MCKAHRCPNSTSSAPFILFGNAQVSRKCVASREPVNSYLDSKGGIVQGKLHVDTLSKCLTIKTRFGCQSARWIVVIWCLTIIPFADLDSSFSAPHDQAIDMDPRLGLLQRVYRGYRLEKWCDDLLARDENVQHAACSILLDCIINDQIGGDIRSVAIYGLTARLPNNRESIVADRLFKRHPVENDELVKAAILDNLAIIGVVTPAIAAYLADRYVSFDNCCDPVVVQSIRGFGRKGQSIGPHLIRHLKSPSAIIRKSVIFTIKQIESVSCFRALCELLDDPDPEVCEKAQETIDLFLLKMADENHPLGG